MCVALTWDTDWVALAATRLLALTNLNNGDSVVEAAGVEIFHTLYNV